MNPLLDHRLLLNRRHFFGRAGLGATALAGLLNDGLLAAPGAATAVAARARRCAPAAAAMSHARSGMNDPSVSARAIHVNTSSIPKQRRGPQTVAPM
jgi:hypothetical protein